MSKDMNHSRGDNGERSIRRVRENEEKVEGSGKEG